MWRKKILPYFHYNKKERAGIIALLIVIVLLWAIPYFFAELSHRPMAPEISYLPAAIKKLEDQQLAKTETDSAVTSFAANSTKAYSSKFSYRMAPFDPNTASAGEWSAMGIKPRTIGIIQNYLSKGGRFNKKEDLQKVYGLKPSDYERLAPFIHINQASDHAGKKSLMQNIGYGSTLNQRKTFNRIDINTAGQEEWESLPGIGEKLALRIVGFREKLGGFARIEQVGETYGIAPEVFEKILPRLVNENPAAIKKVALNQGSFDELKQHPYIGFRLARLLVAYREQHGEYRQLSDLMNIPLVTNEVAVKLSPYLEW
jgi:competence ComEA-like helix-hairpin-helix protein